MQPVSFGNWDSIQFLTLFRFGKLRICFSQTSRSLFCPNFKFSWLWKTDKYKIFSEKKNVVVETLSSLPWMLRFRIKFKFYCHSSTLKIPFLWHKITTQIWHDCRVIRLSGVETEFMHSFSSGFTSQFHRSSSLRCITHGRWSKSSTVPLGLTVTLLTSLCRPSRRKRRNSWASCWLWSTRTGGQSILLIVTTKTVHVDTSATVLRLITKTYLYPTNLGAYLWIWVLNSDGLTASLLDDDHMVCISVANSV